MKTFNLHIQCDNEAFDESAATEIRRILHTVASVHLRDMSLIDDSNMELRDANGNRVGGWIYNIE